MANTETVGQRFIALISHLGMSKNAFAASLDKTATVIQHLVDERNKPGFDLLCKVFEVYPNVSKDWLLQGVGPMLNGENDEAVITAQPPVSLQSAPPVPASALVAPAVASTTNSAPVDEPIRVTEPAAPAAPAVPVTPQDVPVLSSSPSPAPAAPAQPVAQETPAPVLSAPLAATTVAPTPDASWQTALYTQQMAHQLALAELRNQHLQEQQRLMQQMMDLMQRQLTR